MTTDSLTISTTTDSDRGTAPRHRDGARPTKYGSRKARRRAATVRRRVRSLGRVIDRASTAMIGDPKETQR
jgi:hypothetical protein